MNKDEIINYVRTIIEKFGIGHIVTTSEIIDYLHSNRGINVGSIIPSDYCYNRINNGITVESPTVFEYVKHGTYKCLGENYPYSGVIYHKPRGSYEFPIGHCVNGVRFIASTEQQIIESKHQTNEKKQLNIYTPNTHKTQREPSLGLRFSVLKRDNFKCCTCGASPAKDPEVELHIDHVVPWSKGGETELSNLQTLCSKCNIGKSDK